METIDLAIAMAGFIGITWAFAWVFVTLIKESFRE